VREIVGRVLRLPGDRIDRAAPLGSLGLDSLMSIELRNRLERELGVKLSATVAWNYPSVAELASYVVSLVDGIGGTPPTATTPPAAAADLDVLVSGVGALSDDEALAELMGGGGR
jgi:acyl carrier protein